MTTKQQILAEIERLKSKYRHNGLWTSSFQSDLAMAKIESMNELLSFIDTLPDESEQPTRGYDEAYLNEKIAKASKSWEGVDVDKFMDEIRGREPVADCNDLEKEYKEYVDNDPVFSKLVNRNAGIRIARHFAEWGAEHLRDTTKKIPEDLTEAAEDHVRKVVDAAGHPGWEWETRDIEEAFKAGAEWMKRKMISALKNDGDLPIEFIDKFHEIDRAAFQNGQANMRAKMMEGAVEGEVCGRCYGHLNIRFVDGVYKGLEPKNISHIPADVSKYNIGDKVKIIIVKEKEQ